MRPSRTQILFVVAIALWVGASDSLEAQIGRPGPKATLNLAADHTVYAAGSGARIAAWVTIEEGWHVNSHEPTYDYLIATDLTVTAPDWTARMEYPPGELETFSFAELPLSVYQGEVAVYATLAVPVDTPPGSVPVAAVLRYQACNDRLCLPPATAEAEMDLVIGSEGTPAPIPVVAPAPAAAEPAPPAAARRASSGPLLLLLAVVGGLILNAMPCVLPVLSLKLFGLVKSAGDERREVVTGSLATAAGILVSFWALAAAAIIARSAGATVGWGVQFQEPVFVTFLTVIVLLFTLNLWGVFEI